MSNHEHWNELGNLYFMNGAYQPAIHAYLRSIESDGRFGKPYGNLAMTFAQLGKHTDAIKLYRRCIELLTNADDKEIARKRLGVLYREVVENEHALEMSQRNDTPALEEENLENSNSLLDFEIPFTVSMPEVDINTIMAISDSGDSIEEEDLVSINEKFEIAEEESRLAWFENEFMPANPFSYFQTSEDLSNLQSEWHLAYSDEMTSIELATEAEAEFEIEEDILKSFEMIVPIDLEIIATENHEAESSFVEQADSFVEEVESSIEDNILSDSLPTTNIFSEIEPQIAEYSQVEYPLVDLSEAERNSLKNDIAKYKFSAQKNPRNYSVWEMLGDAYKTAGMYKEAIKAFQTAISINSTKPSYYYRLGLIYAIEGREADAVGSFQKVLELDPDHAQAHASLASYYQKVGLDELAESHIEKALSTEFEEESEYNRACLEAIRGNNDRALELLEVALQNKQAYISWAQADPDLDSLRKDHRFHNLLSTYAISE